MNGQPKQNANPTVHSAETIVRESEGPLKTGFNGGPFPFDASDLFGGSSPDTAAAGPYGLTAASLMQCRHQPAPSKEGDDDLLAWVFAGPPVKDGEARTADGGAGGR